KIYDRVIAVPAIGEKGSLNVRVKVTSPGGHSSLPPSHTSIGMLAELLVQYEKHPFEVHLTRGSPTYKSAQCMAQHAPGVSPSLKKHLLLAEHCDKALRAAEQELFMNRAFMSLVGTTQAIDIVEGGVKQGKVLMYILVPFSNTRLIFVVLSPPPKCATSSYADAPSYDTLTLSDAFQEGLEPAPVTPSGTDAAPFQLLSGTIKEMYNSHRNTSGSDAIIVSPGIMSGNTDTRFYWKLTDHIFWSGHQERPGEGSLHSGLHTVNEAISVNHFVEIIRFFTTLILNVDESSLPQGQQVFCRLPIVWLYRTTEECDDLFRAEARRI
ncbi:hypothetical protein K503DRAFT_795880, partial [Rhizopogon vinicolor AM-OR11-026]